METEEEVDILMSSDVYSATLSTKSITFSRSQIGWLFREDKTVRHASEHLKKQRPCPSCRTVEAEGRGGGGRPVKNHRGALTTTVIFKNVKCLIFRLVNYKADER